LEGRSELVVTVNAGARLDRLPVSAFHRRVLILIGIGMFFDGYDLYVAATVMGATLKSGFSTLAQNAQFVSVTFIGMMLGSFLTGFLGDRYGRRFTYQANLVIFGFASLASAFAPNMSVLIFLRGVMGIGLGAELVAGYAAMTEFLPPQVRGRWSGVLNAVIVTSLPVSALVSTLLVPRYGWRLMFVIGGVGALIVWYLRKAMPESPRWLESVGRTEEAESMLQGIEREFTRQQLSLPEPADPATAVPARTFSSLFGPELSSRLFVGATALIVENTLIYGFVTWLPTFFVQQGLSIANSFKYSFLMSIGAPVGAAIAALTADSVGRKPAIIGASFSAILFGGIYPFIRNPLLLPAGGFLLVVSIYILVALLFAIYIPELFPTDVRMRAAGLCNTLGRAATIFTPFLVLFLFRSHGVGGVVSLMIGLLVVQILAVYFFGIEPRMRSLEEMQ
jgi:MFS transporter, putative metabolite:H+ symporter